MRGNKGNRNPGPRGDRSKAGPPGPKRTDEERMLERAELTRLYLAGKPWKEICEHFPHLSLSALQNDMRRIREGWMAEGLVNYTEYINRELAKLDALEAEAWQAWHKSQQERERTVQSTKERGSADEEATARGRDYEVRVEKEGRDGQVGFLAMILNCMRHRAELLGLFATDRAKLGLNVIGSPKGDAGLPGSNTGLITIEDLRKRAEQSTKIREARKRIQGEQGG